MKRLIIVLLLLISGVAVYFNSVSRELVSDDLLYGVVLDDHPLGDNLSYQEEVRTIGDAVRSQATQYLYSNGRTLIHIVVQMFAGPWGLRAFGVFNAIAFIVTVVLFGLLTMAEQRRRDPFSWTLILIGFLYLFQKNSQLWFSYVGSLNYLVPMTLMLVYLLILRRINSGKANGTVAKILIVVFSLICGWSQECFSLPMSGALFFWLIINRKGMRSELLYTIIPFWIGTIILFVAPGNFVRLGTQPSHMLLLRNAVKYFLFTWFVWSLAVVSVCAYIKFGKDWFVEFIKKNSLLVIALVLVCALGCVANTLPQSFSGVSFYSAIISYLLLWQLLPAKFPRRFSIAAVSVIWTLIAVHQVRLVEARRYLQRINHEFVVEYIASPDGVMTRPEIHLSADVRPFVNDWHSSQVSWWLYHTLNCRYFDGKKPITIAE